MSVKVRMQGPFGLFKHPASGVDPVSMEFPSQSALVGILSRIWKPPRGCTVWAKRVRVLSEPRLVPVQVNGQKRRPGPKHQGGPSSEGDPVAQRMMMVLVEPDYIVDYEVERGPGCKFSYTTLMARIDRNVRRGTPTGMVTFGGENMQARYHRATKRMLAACPPIDKTFDYGMCFYGLDWADRKCPEPIMFHAYMENGVIEYPFIPEAFIYERKEVENAPEPAGVS